MRKIVENIAYCLSAGADSVLVTVVKSKGSTPREAGSQMLVSKDGLICGTIGGGAMEGRAIEKAIDLIGQCDEAGKSLSRTENLALRMQEQKGLDMPCGGDASLLYTFIRHDDEDWVLVADELLRCFDQRISASLVLACQEDAGSFDGCVALVSESGALLAGTCANGLPAVLTDLASAGQKRIVGDYFVMPIQLPVRAIVFGGGHVGRATVAALARVGFACTLFEERAEFAQSERVPDAREVIVGDYEDIAASLAFDERDYVLIMTHSHRFDYAILEQALRQPLAYVGFMGSRRKIATACERLLKAGVSEDAIATVHMPIGLDIKAETPEEIAVSVAAECILHRATC